jgi:hypothetical protein
VGNKVKQIDWYFGATYKDDAFISSRVTTDDCHRGA